MSSQERKHTVGLEKMPRYRLSVKKLTLILRSTLHPSIICENPKTATPPRRD